MMREGEVNGFGRLQINILRGEICKLVANLIAPDEDAFDALVMTLAAEVCKRGKRVQGNRPNGFNPTFADERLLLASDLRTHLEYLEQVE